jgi:error-prone DNA polymerase
VNACDVWATVENDSLRVGLGFVRDWSEETATAVVAEREERGPFRSIGDFIRRAPPILKRPAMEHLVWVGGCDVFGLTRRELLWQVGLWLPPIAERSDDARGRRQLELPLDQPYERLRFGGLGHDERLLAEYAVLGFAASGHPLSLVRDALPPGLVRSDGLAAIAAGSRVAVAGLVVARQRPQTAKGFIFLLLEDETGMINVIVRPDVYERYRTAVRGEPFVRVAGKLTRDGGKGGSMNVIAEEVTGLAAGRFITAMRQVAPDSKDWG